jgi:hypothetical protein
MMKSKPHLTAFRVTKATAHLLLFFLLLFITMTIPADAGAQYRGRDEYRGPIYGQFCPGSRRGGPYGERNPVATVEQARQVIEKCSAIRNQERHAGKIKENPVYFQAEILDRNGAMVDEVIIHRRNGRVRSIYDPRPDTQHVRGALDAKE